MSSAADRANQQMVDRLIAQGTLWSPPLLAAFRATPRHRFLDRVFQYARKHGRWREVLTRDPGEEELRLVYSDRALITHLSPSSAREPEMPISSSSQPSLMAQMLEDLRAEPGMRVLEVGAGTGYNAALLAHVAGPGRVTSVDVDRRVLAEAWDHLRAFADRQVVLKHADGRQGYAEGAPYDRVMVTAATPDLEPAWLEQAEGGLVLAPLALAPGLAYVACGEVGGGVFRGRLTRAAYFMPLRTEGEAGHAGAELPPARGPFRPVPAPWAGWFDRRRQRLVWPGFTQALAFYGFVRGLEVRYQTLDEGEPAFGVGDEKGFCWLGHDGWHVDGDAGRDLGDRLWRAFLDAGGPWPTEFRLTAGPHAPPAPAAGGACYARPGPCCHHLWELAGPRDRPGWL